MGRYANFWQVTEDALVFAANSLKLDLTTGKRGGLMQAFLEIKAWPDAVPALEALKSAAFASPSCPIGPPRCSMPR